MKGIKYPFSAIVGQEDMKTALLVNAVSPVVGGVLILGEKGTAKSTAVRALAAILPPFAGAEGEAMEVVELPVNATEDRVVGTIDLEQALQEGKKRFEPGLLAKAHNNMLYVDEINLLDDHVVDVLLDAAAMGVNTVEREGISYSHPSRFVLVGTMNPEEGDLRPQLLDRFGLSVVVTGERDVAQRVEVLRRRMAFEADREAFVASYAAADEALREQVSQARARLEEIPITEELLKVLAYLSIAIGVDGHRPDIAMLHTARALAALEDAPMITRKHIRKAAQFVLPHRLRRRPFEEQGLSEEQLDFWLTEAEAFAHEES